jgi:hypothetical protein
MAQGLQSDHVRTAPYTIPGPTHVEPRLRTWQVVREWLVIAREIFDAVVHGEER